MAREVNCIEIKYGSNHSKTPVSFKFNVCEIKFHMRLYFKCVKLNLQYVTLNLKYVKLN